MNTNCYFDVNEFVNDLDLLDDYGPQGDVVDSLRAWQLSQRERISWEAIARAQQLKLVVATFHAQWEIKGKFNPRDKGYSYVAGKMNRMGLRGRRGARWNAETVGKLIARLEVLGESYNKKESN